MRDPLGLNSIPDPLPNLYSGPNPTTYLTINVGLGVRRRYEYPSLVNDDRRKLPATYRKIRGIRGIGTSIRRPFRLGKVLAYLL